MAGVRARPLTLSRRRHFDQERRIAFVNEPPDQPHNEQDDADVLHGRTSTFYRSLYRLAYQECPDCHEVVLSEQARACDQCRRSPAKYSSANNMDPGRDVPECLSVLTLAESMLIAQVNPIMAIYLLPAGNQFGTRGHAISFPQDIQGFINNLPRSVKDLDVLVLLKSRGDQLPAKEFRVRRQKVFLALVWLKGNNPYYRDITIDEALLDRLPRDDVIQLTQQQVGTHDQPAIDDDSGPTEPDAEDAPGTTNTFCPAGINRPTELQSLRQRFEWPTCDRDNPVNEFETEGFIARAFPCLFPKGQADLKAPRNTRVTAIEYFRHLMNYVDGRFRTDPRFIFYAHSCCDRWTALTLGKVYSRRHHADDALSLLQVRTLLESGDVSIPKRILRFGASLRGTKQYWFARSEELTEMVAELGPAHFFFTFSSADTKWPDLHRLLPGVANNNSQAVAANPWLVDQYCTQRFNSFFKEILKPYLNVTDYWYRFEFQHRGSVHTHGMAWIDHPPISECSDQMIRDLADRVISCNNPAIPANETANNFFYQIDQHPSSIDYNAVLDREEDLKQLANSLQRHVRCRPYCQRRRPDGEVYCRFKFPFETREGTTVSRQPRENTGDVRITVEHMRNDGTMNKMNPYLLQSWRGNMDLSFITDLHDCAKYIAKYTTKSEPASQSYVALYKQMVVEEMRPEQSFAASAQKLLLKTVGSRDQSIQECCHLLSDEPLFNCSRAFVTISFDGDTVLEEVGGLGTSAITKYRNRPDAFANSSYAEVMCRHTLRNNRGRTIMVMRQKPAVVRYLPVLDSCKERPGYPQYCRQQLGLHKPFREFSDLTNGFVDEVQAYEAFLLTRDRTNVRDPAGEVVAAAQELTADDFPLPVRVRPDHYIMGMHDLEAEIVPPAQQADDDYWSSTHGIPPATIQSAGTFIEMSKQTANIRNVVEQGHHGMLNPQQQVIYNLIADHSEGAAEPLHVIVCGTAGTGKSFLLSCLRSRLGERATIAAPTGVAATNVNGQTLHSLLCLGKSTSPSPLTGTGLASYQERWYGKQYLFIDEMSMIGLTMLAAIDQRLREARPLSSDKPFGAISVILLGDFGQLCPIGDPVMYTSAPGSAVNALAGQGLFRLFDKVYVLERVVRQANDREFAALLERLRQGTPSQLDYDTLCQRVAGSCGTNCPPEATRLFTNTAAVHEHNVERLNAMHQPIATIEANNSTRAASRFDSDKAGGLGNSLSLCIGAQVMLRTNLWTSAGLVNGSTGVVQAVLYPNNSKPPALPQCVVVSFAGYRGPAFHEEWPGSVPIVPIRRNWKDGIRSHSRTGLPLSLAWSFTIHKAQGLTLDSVFVDLGSKEISVGLSFVALSRVRRLTDLYMAPFPFDRISHLGENPTMRMRKRFEEGRQRIEE